MLHSLLFIIIYQPTKPTQPTQPSQHNPAQPTQPNPTLPNPTNQSLLYMSTHYAIRAGYKTHRRWYIHNYNEVRFVYPIVFTFTLSYKYTQTSSNEHRLHDCVELFRIDIQIVA